MTEAYFWGGYYLVEGSDRSNWMNPSLIPQKFYSVSNCICSHHPSLSMLSWTCDAGDKEKYRTKLGLTVKEFQALQNKADRWFDLDLYAWGEVLLDLDLAKEFAANYLSHLQNIKLLAIATTANYRDLFLQSESALNNSEIGICQALKSHQTIEIERTLASRYNGLQTRNAQARDFLGYEILGYEYGGFHSFVCNHLETDFANKLKIKLNQYGLIEQYDLATKASDYANNPNTGAEPVLWMPWAIVELDLAQ